MSKEQEIIEINRLCDKSSFQPNDLATLVNLYKKHLNPDAAICMSCTGSLRAIVNTFQQNKDNMIKKINDGI